MKQIFLFIVLFTIVQRLYELRLSHKNEKKIIAQGGHVVPELNYVFMVAMHSLWLASIILGVYLGYAEFNLNYLIPGLSLLIVGQLLRILAIKTLKNRWTTRIVILPEAPAVHRGIFKWLRHPNYLGVCLEIFALPLAAGLVPIAIVFTIINLIILKFRIKKEEESLKKHNMYSKVFNLNKDINGARS